MKAWEKKLAQWVDSGLISAHQAETIREHEARAPGPSWVLSGLYLLGAFVIGVGIISVVAANWHKIPDLVKIGAAFLLLMASASFVFRSWVRDRPWVYDAGLAIFLLLCLATIGLLAQIYNTGGTLSQALSFWLLITLPAMLSARAAAIPSVWICVFAGTYVAEMLDASIFQLHSSHRLLFSLVSLPLFFLVIFLAFRSRLKDSLIFTLQFALIGSGLVALAFCDLSGSYGGEPRNVLGHPLSFGVLALSIPAIVLIFMTKFYRRNQKLLLATAVLFLLVAATTRFADLDLPKNVPALFTLGSLGAMSLFHAARQQERLFQFAFFLIAVRFLIVYFEAFAGLAMTGFGLIVSGALIVGTAIVWQKYRKVLAGRLERWVNG